MRELAIVITGLPASGKTSLGRKLAEKLNMAFLDKDDFLEGLFEQEGIGDLSWRLALSQKSNFAFQKTASKHECIVLVSHWRPLGDTGTSGTPTEWLSETYREVVEVFCNCETEEAVKRFTTRKRHKGHCDRDRNIEEIRESFIKYTARLPLNLGRMIKIDANSISQTDDAISKLIEQLPLS